MFKRPYTISVFISAVFITLLTPPILLAFNQGILVFGIPLLFLYIIILWLLLVVLMLWLTSKNQSKQE